MASSPASFGYSFDNCTGTSGNLTNDLVILFATFRPLRILQILDKWLSHDLLINQFDSFISLCGNNLIRFFGVSHKYNWLLRPPFDNRIDNTFATFRHFWILQILDKRFSHDLQIDQFDSFISLIGVSLKYNGFFARSFGYSFDNCTGTSGNSIW